jgi:hypothetical protein
MPHPLGDIAFRYRTSAGIRVFDVSLPPGLKGTFEWSGQSALLAEGANHFEFRN